MELDKQVISLEYAQRLKELGVKQVSLVYWFRMQDIIHTRKNDNGDIQIDHIDYKIELGNPFAYGVEKNDVLGSAFTCSELGDMLPPNINEWGLAIDATSCPTSEAIKSLWAIIYADYDKKLFEEIKDLNLCNAMAKTLIYLIENGLIEVEK